MVTVRNVSKKWKMIGSRLVYPGQTTEIPEKLARRLKGVAILDQPAQGQPVQDKEQLRPSISSGHRFAFAGRLEGLSRAEAEKLVTDAGHQVGELTEETTYLVVGQNPGKAISEAEVLGVEVLPQGKFEELVRQWSQ